MLTLLPEAEYPLIWESEAKRPNVPQGRARAEWGCLQSGHSASTHGQAPSHWALPWPQTWRHTAAGHQMLETLRQQHLTLPLPLREAEHK